MFLVPLENKFNTPMMANLGLRHLRPQRVCPLMMPIGMTWPTEMVFLLQ
jgi:hypothetical protein